MRINKIQIKKYEEEKGYKLAFRFYLKKTSRLDRYVELCLSEFSLFNCGLTILGGAHSLSNYNLTKEEFELMMCFVAAYKRKSFILMNDMQENFDKYKHIISNISTGQKQKFLNNNSGNYCVNFLVDAQKVTKARRAKFNKLIDNNKLTIAYGNGINFKLKL